MIPLTFHEIQLIIAATLFFVGCLCVLLGILLLVTRGYSRQVGSIAAHTAKLGQKGITQDIAGLVSSATELVASINDLSRTASGVAFMLIAIGLGMVAGAYWIFERMQWPI
jgi:hypothetical protein